MEPKASAQEFLTYIESKGFKIVRKVRNPETGSFGIVYARHAESSVHNIFVVDANEARLREAASSCRGQGNIGRCLRSRASNRGACNDR